MPKRKSIFHSALLLTLVNLLLRMAGTSFQVYLSGKIGAAGIGLLQLVLSVGGLSLTAGMAGIRTATMYLTAEELGKKRPQNVVKVLRGSFLYSLICSGCVAIGLWSFAPVIAQGWIGDIRTIPAIRLFALFLPVSCLCGVMTGYFTAANRIGTLALVEIGEQALSILITLTSLSLWAQDDPAVACMCVIGGSGIGGCMTFICLLLLFRRSKNRAKTPIPIRKRLFQTAVPLALADDLKAGISTTENLMVPKRLALFSAANPLAAFGMVCGMVFPVLMFPAAILFGLNELLIPELARCRAAESYLRIRYLSKRSLKVALLYGCLFCGLEFLLAQPLCQKLYDNADAGNFLRLYALLIPMLYCDAVTDAMTKGLGQQKTCVRYNILTSAMDVILLFILLPQYGMEGYFASFLVTHLLNFALSLRRLCRIAEIRIPFYPPAMTAVATACGILGALFVSSVPGKIFAFLAIWFCLLYLFRVIGKEDILWLKNLSTKK